MNNSAGDQTRTDTPLLGGDFKSDIVGLLRVIKTYYGLY